MPPINNWVVESILLPPDRRSAEHAARAEKLLARVLMPVNAHMDGREWLASDFSIADTITGHACLVSMSLVGVDAAAMPHLAGYVERLKARPALRKALSL